MRCSQPLRTANTAGVQADLVHYWRDGYAILRGFFSADEIDQIAAGADQIYAEGVAHGRSFRHGNLFYNVATVTGGEPQVRMVQWPSYHPPALDRVRLNTRYAAFLQPLI